MEWQESELEMVVVDRLEVHKREVDTLEVDSVEGEMVEMEEYKILHEEGGYERGVLG